MGSHGRLEARPGPGRIWYGLEMGGGRRSSYAPDALLYQTVTTPRINPGRGVGALAALLQEKTDQRTRPRSRPGGPALSMPGVEKPKKTLIPAQQTSCMRIALPCGVSALAPPQQEGDQRAQEAEDGARGARRSARG